MAPIKVKHIVSFSSEDPKHPVETLLSQRSVHPWLSCPQDRSRQLKVELQLERACPIGYIDTGNSGSAFLQIDVGRSSWPLEKPFVTLLPTATLMTPADSKSGKNRNGVRMFKEGDFLAEAACEKWDRVRIGCSQPFNKQDQFGLSFVRFRTPVDEEDQKENRTSSAVCSQNEGSREESTATPLLSNPAFRKMLIREAQETDPQGRVEDKLKDQSAVSVSSPRLASAACLSRTARMVLSAAKTRKRSFPAVTPPSPSPPAALGEQSGAPEAGDTGQSPAPSGSWADTSRTPPTPPPQECMKPSGRRRLSVQGPPRRGRGRPRTPERRLTQKRERDRVLRIGTSPETERDCSSCPICGGYFRVDYLPSHASTCGEDPLPHSLLVSSTDEDSSSDDLHISLVHPEQAVLWLPCPLCGFRFRSTEIERHASTCGEQAAPPVPDFSWF
ncbi:protein XNDC1N isoform X1 [Ascaphus truei]|uniref:protein XNDC1N isoform X1 n=1 Tax=Ascaphus truei TaxID=8439 RepID=UPI003F59FACF